MADILREDLAAIVAADFVDWEALRGRSVLVTGGTGLIGCAVIAALRRADEAMDLHLRILALVRHIEKAEQLLGEADEGLQFLQGSVEALPAVEGEVDYIIHGASPTASLFFVEHPVETIRTAVCGTMNLLQLAKEKGAKGFLYLSSMEVYGAPHEDSLIPEKQGCTLDSMTVRSCYPIAKRLSENLCASFAKEYGVPAKVIRLAQTFGPGVAKEDKRVFAEFARDAMEGKDIILQTAGTSKREYLYTADAVTAILTVLLRGEAGEAYNAGNPETYCSIVEMAKLVAEEIAGNAIAVKVPAEINENSSQFPPPHRLYLDVTKLQSLGWRPTRGLKDMYRRMIGAFGE